MSATITVNASDFVREVIPEEDPDPSYLEQDGWEDRLAEYRRGDFGYCGVRASVEIVIPQVDGVGKPYGICQRIETPGLWGIEDDSGEEYLAETFKDECATLRDMLAALNVQVIEG